MYFGYLWLKALNLHKIHFLFLSFTLTKSWLFLWILTYVPRDFSINHRQLVSDNGVLFFKLDVNKAEKLYDTEL